MLQSQVSFFILSHVAIYAKNVANVNQTNGWFVIIMFFHLIFLYLFLIKQFLLTQQELFMFWRKTKTNKLYSTFQFNNAVYELFCKNRFFKLVGLDWHNLKNCFNEVVQPTPDHLEKTFDITANPNPNPKPKPNTGQSHASHLTANH